MVNVSAVLPWLVLTTGADSDHVTIANWIGLVGIALPIFIGGATYVGKTIGGWMALRRQRRALRRSLHRDIVSIIDRNGNVCASYERAYAQGKPEGLMARRIADDPRYAPYVAIADTRSTVFDPAEKDFSFLGETLFATLVSCYDNYDIVTAIQKDFRSDAFKELKPFRKLQALGELTKLYRRNIKEFKAAKTALEKAFPELQSAGPDGPG